MDYTVFAFHLLTYNSYLQITFMLLVLCWSFQLTRRNGRFGLFACFLVFSTPLLSHLFENTKIFKATVMIDSQIENSLSVLEGRLESLNENPKDYVDVFPVSAQCLYFHLAGQDYLRKYSITPDPSISKKALESLHEGIKLSIRQLDSADGESA